MKYRSRLLTIIRINALLRNARRLAKAGEFNRVKTFTDEAKATIDMFVEASKE